MLHRRRYQKSEIETLVRTQKRNQSERVEPVEVSISAFEEKRRTR